MKLNDADWEKREKSRQQNQEIVALQGRTGNETGI
jgi:hypothetical protein